MKRCRAGLAHSLISLVALAGCGGDPPLDAQGTAMASAAVHVSGGLESTAATGYLFSAVDLSVAPAPGALDTTARVLGDVLGGCLTATATEGARPSLTIRFAAGGCGIPLTPIHFSGAMSLSFVESQGRSLLDLRFTKLELLDHAIDGEVSLSSGADGLSWTASNLVVDVGGETVTIDGQGTLSRARLGTAVVFDGRGMITVGEVVYSFVADHITRALRDCYADSGTLVVTTMVGDAPAVTMTLRFTDDSHDQGKVTLEYGGRTRDWLLPARGCANR